MAVLPLPLAEGGTGPRAHGNCDSPLQVAEKENHAGEGEAETGESCGGVGVGRRLSSLCPDWELRLLGSKQYVLRQMQEQSSI